MNKNIEVSIVIPAFNEGDHLKNSLMAIQLEVEKVSKSYEIIIVDDGSRDNTWKQIEDVCEESPFYRGIKLSRNFGKELALCAGLENAKGKAAIVMDADMQHPPKLISEMVTIWREKNVPLVECVKRTRGNESFKNKVGSRLFYGIINKLTKYDLNGASDFKLLDRVVIEAWSKSKERNTFFRGMVAWVGFQSEKIEFDVPDRVSGFTHWSVFSLVRLAINAIVSFSSLPLRFVNIIGLLFLCSAIILGIQTLYLKFIGTAITGFTTVILLLLIIGSFTMISLGIIGEYIAAIYNEVKGRPRYLVEQRIENDDNSENTRVEPLYESVTV